MHYSKVLEPGVQKELQFAMFIKNDMIFRRKKKHVVALSTIYIYVVAHAEIKEHGHVMKPTSGC